jgi:outer membrane protein with beta-barrel domain
MEALMRSTAAVSLFLLLVPAAARGQSPAGPVSRADVAVSTGWFAADRSIAAACCSSWSAGLFKGVSGGFYWTDHLKTEAAVAAPGVTEGYGSSSEPLANGSFQYTSERHRYDGTKFSIAQIYQFGRNSTFHPFVVAGVDVDRERDAMERYVSTASTHLEDERIETTIRGRAFAGAGFKAYFSERAFFKGEARFAGGRRGDQMTWTAGVGIDLGGRRGQSTVADTSSHAGPRAQEPLDVWRRYVSQLKTGSLLDVMPAGSDRFTAQFVAADADGILVKPSARVPEPVRHVAFDRLETLALHDGPRPGSRVGATLAGVGAGAGTFTIVLMMLLSHVGG